MDDVIFFETSVFTRWVVKHRAQAAIKRLRDVLSANPNRGTVIRGGGGLRKIRVAPPGRVKSGGYRVIDIIVVRGRAIVFIAGYAKNEKEDLSTREIANLRAHSEEVVRQIETSLGTEGED